MSMSCKKILEDNATCSVCLEIFVDPRMLQCQHTFCQQCVNGLNEGGVVKCPVCRKEYRFFSNFPVNRMAVTFVEIYEASKTEVVRDPCKQHPEKNLEMFCYTCKLPLCVKCKFTTQRHKLCKVGDLDTAFQEYKEMSKSILQKQFHEINKLKASISKAEKILKDLQCFSRNAQETVDDCCEPAVKSLESYKESKKTQIRHLVQTENEYVSKKLNDLKTKRERVANSAKILREIDSILPGQINKIIANFRYGESLDLKAMDTELKKASCEEEIQDILKNTPVLNKFKPADNNVLKYKCLICEKVDVNLVVLTCSCESRPNLCFSCYDQHIISKGIKKCLFCKAELSEPDALTRRIKAEKKMNMQGNIQVKNQMNFPEKQVLHICIGLDDDDL